MDEHELLKRITAAVRTADKNFERVGGSSRHWVRDCFLPELEQHDLRLVLVNREPSFIDLQDATKKALQ